MDGRCRLVTASGCPQTCSNMSSSRKRLRRWGVSDGRWSSSLAALAAFDARHPRSACAQSRQQRTALVREASIALWYFVIQREACGLRDLRYVLRDYRVPPEVAVQMGALPQQPSGLPR